MATIKELEKAVQEKLIAFEKASTASLVFEDEFQKIFYDPKTAPKDRQSKIICGQFIEDMRTARNKADAAEEELNAAMAAERAAEVFARKSPPNYN